MSADKDSHWIEHADLNKGSFSAKAKKAGMGTQSFAKKETGAKGKLGKQARLARTFSKMNK